MRTWILLSASIIAIAIRPEVNKVEVVGQSVAVVWLGLLVVGLIMDIGEHVKRTRQ